MSSLHIGYCITAHGFGHAARAMAVMEQIANQVETKLTVASLVPEWFLRSSYTGPMSVFPIQTDVGLVQQGPLEQDIPATLKALADYYPVRKDIIHSLAKIFSECNMVVCDIAPSGILAAREAGIPSVLIENFTWDWIYEGYISKFPELDQFISYHQEINAQADYRIQAMPVCEQRRCDLIVQPISRTFRENRNSVRRKLKIRDDQQMVLISMGGIGLGQLPLAILQEKQEITFVIPGYAGKEFKASNLIFLQSDTGLFHPDLIAASDAVIGKVGYSTLAEVYHADVPFGYVSREWFRESGPLVSFVREKMRGMEISTQDFNQGQWLNILPKLFQLEKNVDAGENGALQCAKFLLSLV